MTIVLEKERRRRKGGFVSIAIGISVEDRESSTATREKDDVGMRDGHGEMVR